MNIADLTPAERRLWRAFPRGDEVDFRQGDDEPERGDRWGPERTVRGEVISALLLGGVQEDGRIAALRLMGARISGVLNLQYGMVGHAVRLWACHFERRPIFYGAQMRQLNLSESYLPGLDAATVQMKGVLRLTDCRIPGEVRLGGAKISGAVFLNRARLGDEQGDHKNPALQLNHAVINDDLWAVALAVHGQVRLSGAAISGAVNLDHAHLSAPRGTALKADSFTVGSNLTAKALHTTGRLDMRGAKIPGQFNLAGAQLSNPGGVALRASSCVIGELWMQLAAPVEGSVNLRRSQIQVIDIKPKIWPKRVRLDGLTYGSLTPRLPADERLKVLDRDEEGYVPYAYEQLAAAYRRIGDDAGARAVQLAKLRRHRSTLPIYSKIWGHLQDITVGYGFRPTRAMAWLLGLLVLGSTVYGLHHPQPLETKTPDFHASVYTLDLLLPIVDFGQEKAFSPHGWYLWLAYLLTAAGWVLATTVIAGITRAVNRQ